MGSRYCPNCKLWLSHGLWKDAGKKCPQCGSGTLTAYQWNKMIEKGEQIAIENFQRK